METWLYFAIRISNDKFISNVERYKRKPCLNKYYNMEVFLLFPHAQMKSCHLPELNGSTQVQDLWQNQLNLASTFQKISIVKTNF